MTRFSKVLFYALLLPLGFLLAVLMSPFGPAIPMLIDKWMQ